MKSSAAFRAVYRRGRWARGQWLSLGTLQTQAPITRIGLRTKRGLKGAVLRNRLKRQVRAILTGTKLRTGRDIVIVVHPPTFPVSSGTLRQELGQLCQRLNIAA